MTDVGVRGAGFARARFRTRPDGAIHGPGPGFVLDPLLLDTATHPMFSGLPEVWDRTIAPGQLAYPVRATDMRFYGPRPQGEVECRLQHVPSPRGTLCFDVALIGPQGPWATFRWLETLVPGGPVLGRPAEERYAFVWKEQPVETVRIGRPRGARWRVERADRVEPIDGTLAGLYCTAYELEQRRRAPDPLRWDLARLAAKEAIRQHLRERLGRDLHPRQVELLHMRDDRAVVFNLRGLDAQTWLEHLGPTRFHLCLERGEDYAEAWFEPTGWPT